MITLLLAVTQIQTIQVSMDQNQMYALIASIQVTAPVLKLPPVYARNPGQVDSNKITDHGSAVGTKRYRYANAALSLNEFDHTTGKFLEITTSLIERSDKSGWGSGTGSIADVKVVSKTYDLFREYVQFTVEELDTHIKVYVDADKKRTEYNSGMLATCTLASVSAGTRSKFHAVYDDFKIGRMVYGELVFKGLMNKAIFDNRQTTRYLQDQYGNLPSYMTTCDSDIAKFILEWRNVVSFLESHDVVLIDKSKIMWRAFELCKDAYFVEYVGRKQEAHEEGESPAPSLTVAKLLNFSVYKYTDRSHTDNHVWGLSSKREAKFSPSRPR